MEGSIEAHIPFRIQTRKADNKNQRPAETSPCKVTIPINTFWSLITGKNCTGDGGDSIFRMASTAIASGPIVLGFLKKHKKNETVV